MSEPIRVLHVFGALNPGGIETLVMNIYRAIDREKIQFDFALTQGKKSFFDDEVLSMGGRIFYFDLNKNKTANLNAIMRDKGPFDAVHSHVYFYSGNVLRIAAKYDIPVRISHAHNTSFGQKNTVIRLGFEFLMRRWILKYATHMLGCSVDADEFVFGNCCMDDPRCSVFYNAFDVDAFAYNAERSHEIRKQYGIDDKFIVGHAGRFETQKNHTQLVEQFAAIKKKRADAVLFCVGRGSLMDDIRAKCERLGISDSVIFVGAQKDMADYYSAMDVFLFPSLYEGLGSALIEAQANGLYCVTTKELVPDDINVTGHASFVPLSSSAEVWADAVLAAGSREQDGTSNRIVKEKYDIRLGTDRLSNIYLGR